MDGDSGGASIKHLNRETIELTKTESKYRLVGGRARYYTISLGEEGFATSQRKEHTSQRVVIF